MLTLNHEIIILFCCGVRHGGGGEQRRGAQREVLKEERMSQSSATKNSFQTSRLFAICALILGAGCCCGGIGIGLVLRLRHNNNIMVVMVVSSRMMGGPPRRHVIKKLWTAALILLVTSCDGFQPPSNLQRKRSRTSTAALDIIMSDNKSPSTTTSLLMSSIPDDDDNFNAFQLLVNFKLPPLPEDNFALSGDVLALFVYSYIDHTIMALFYEASRIDLKTLISTTLDPNSNAAIPVWFDPSHIMDRGHWLIQNSVANPYAPAINAAGLAFVSISFCWIICGYFTRAFEMKNTLECDTSDAILVTGKTWALMALMMVGLAWGSDWLWHQIDLIHPQGASSSARGGLTVADADFIFDSLTVLAFWRMLYNAMLGYRRR